MKEIKLMAEGMINDDILTAWAESKNLTLKEARLAVSQMSFVEYLTLVEAGSAIVPPSGQAIGSTANATAPVGTGSNIKAIWPGNGAPVEVGMTVGLKGPNGLPVPGQVSQVDLAAKGVRVKNPTTGQEEWQNIDSLNPFTTANSSPEAAAAAAGNVGKVNQQPALTTEESELVRMKQLAGIKENCSGGATGAGAIAIAPAPMGKMQKREVTDEELKKEYTRTDPAKTIVGDTKPHQASGELSATLAANGKKTASRINNGMKRV